MAFQHIVTLDMEGEGFDVAQNTVAFAQDGNLEDHIRNMSRKFPLHTICVYSLSHMQKLKGKPTYNRYRVNEKGEVIPE